MSRDKHIEEIARAMCFSKDHCTVTSCVKVNCEKTWLAEALYNAGYRKSEDVAMEIFEDILKIKGLTLNDWLAISELKKKYESEGAE